MEAVIIVAILVSVAVVVIDSAKALRDFTGERELRMAFYDLTSRLAHTAQSKAAQYAGLAGYVVAQAIIFVPLLVMANLYAPGAIQSAGLVTMAGFAGLTAIAFTTRKDFSFLGGILGSLVRLPWILNLALSIGCAAGLIWYFRRRQKTSAAGISPPTQPPST